MRGDRRRALIVVIAALVFAGVFALRLSSDDPSETIGVLFVIPIALVAYAFGIPGALAVAGLSFGAVVVWDVTQDVGLDARDYLLRAAAFLTMALTIGTVSAGPRSARVAQRQMIESAPDALLAVDAEGEIKLANARAAQLFGHPREEMAGKPIEAIVSSDTGEGGRGFIAEFLSDSESAQLGSPLELRGRHRLGHEFPCEISLSALETRTGTMALAAIRDITERKRGEEELRRAVRRLEASTEIAHAIGGETELETILDAIVDRGRSLVEASGLVVMLADGEGLIVAATAGNVDERIRGMHVDLAGLTGAAVRTLRPQRIDRMKEISAMPGKERRAPGHASAAIVVPLEFRGSALGVVVAFDRRDGPAFTDEDERMLLSFAASAATAVATARDVAEDRLRRAIEAAEQERTRWARELHDETLQGLGALRVALASALRGSTEGLEEVVATAVDEIAEEIRSLRSLIAELRPAALDELGLAAAIETLSERSASLVGLEMDTHVDLGDGRSEDGESRLDPELESTIYRLVQESLSNIAKHARAERVSLRVHEADGSIEVSIEDDGVGFDPETSDRGFGLVGMRERVSMVGGQMEIRSSPGQGATVAARLPTRPTPRSSVGA